MGESTENKTHYGPISFTLRLILVFSIMAPLSIIYVLLCFALLPARSLRIRAGNVYGKVVGPLVFKIAGIRPIIANRERVEEHAPALYLCNHTSTVDMWIGMWLCPFGGCGVAKKEITRVPCLGQAYQLSGHLLVDRKNREKAIESMASAGDLVKKHGMSIWMWPEGTRSRDGRLQPFKKGFVHLAIATGLPIIPIVFHDADILWPGRTFRTTPGDLHINILEPIDTSNWKAETASEHAQEVRQAFQTTLGPRQNGADPGLPDN